MIQLSAKYYNQIDLYVCAHRQEMVDNLIRLIAVPSVKSPPLPGMPFGKNCAMALAEGMKICVENKMETVCHENYAASAICGVGDKEIGFIAHLDVVPPGDGWMSDPFIGFERDGFVIGRGSRDNKAGFVSALLAINCIRNLGVPLHSSLRLIMGSDEESGMSDMDYYVKNCPLPDFSIITDCYFPVAHGEKGRISGNILINVDPKVLKIYGGEASNIIPSKCRAELPNRIEDLEKLKLLAEQYDGIDIEDQGNNIRITATGISAHASEPEKGVNAIHKLATFLSSIDVLPNNEAKAMRFIHEAFNYYFGEYFNIDFKDEVSGNTTLIAGMIHTEEDGLVKLNIDSRYSVNDHKERILPILIDVIEKVGYRFELLVATNSHFISAFHPVAQRLTEVFNFITGEQKKPYILSGGTYASRVPNSVAFGPGNVKEPMTFPYGPGHGDAHQPDESQDIVRLLEAAKIYAMSIIELDEILHS